MPTYAPLAPAPWVTLDGRHDAATEAAFARMDARIARDAWTEAVAAHYAALDGTVETTLRSVDADLHWYALGGVASPFAVAAGY